MIPFVDLTAHHRPLAPELEKKLRELLESSQFILGDEVARFEEEFAQYIGSRWAVGVGSGTAALQLAFEALIEPGDEVLVPAHTYVASAFGVSHAGGVPVFVDVRDSDYALDPERLEAAVTPRTRAVLAVHLYGHPAPMDEIQAFARRHDLRVVEDCAQAHGARYRGQRVGSFGDAGCFSFYPSKNLGALGDGGAVLTSDEQVRDRVRELRHLGQRVKNLHESIGHNERLDTLQAAFLRVKLPNLERSNELRNAAAARYAHALAGNGLRLPQVARDCTHVYHLYVVRHPRVAAIAATLERAGIACGVYYPQPVPCQPCYGGEGASGAFPVSEQITRDSLALPMYPELSSEQIEEVARVVRSALAE